MPLSQNKRIKSFGYALTGIRYFVASQLNAQIQLTIACLVIILGFALDISPTEWCVVLLCIGIVIVAEAFNTAIESLCDTLHPSISDGIKTVKDVAAGAVLIATIIAVTTGLCIFVPKLLLIFDI